MTLHNYQKCAEVIEEISSYVIENDYNFLHVNLNPSEKESKFMNITGKQEQHNRVSVFKDKNNEYHIQLIRESV